MKIKYMTKEYWNVIETKGKLLSKRLWTISALINDKKCEWIFIRETSYLWGKEFYVMIENIDIRKKEKINFLKYSKKKEYQTYVRGLRRNIKKFYNSEYTIVDEEFIESEEARI